ncbi:MAG: isoprenylcysteine carboxylmethyltransferase family protein [Acidobacteriota bacterium]
MGISKRHLAAIIAQGGCERSSNYLPAVKLLHTSWFLAMIAEVFYFDRPFIPLLAVIGLLGAITGQYLRHLSMRALGARWTLPITILPNVPAVDQGIYRYIRHPNWLGVIIELALVPLIHTAYLTTILFSIANAFVMWKRIQAEEAALSEANNYQAVFKNRPRFIPSLRRIESHEHRL